MSNQYFENNEKLESNPVEIKYYIKGFVMNFLTDNGVFSKKAVDFGSSLLLKSLPTLNNVNILDVGCGYGTIGLTIAKMNPTAYVTMVDINQRAVLLTNKNMISNQIKNAEIFVSDIYNNVHQKYDFIVTNPPIRAGKKVVHNITLGAIAYLKDGGQMWCVIQKKQGAESLLIKLKDTFSNVEIISKDKGYFIIKSIK